MNVRLCVASAAICTMGLAAVVLTPAVAQTPSAEELKRQTLEQRAVTAAIWGMPIVSVYAVRQAFFRDAKANYNDVVFWSKPSDWKNQTTTPNASARYVYFNFNTKEGPVVVEIPPAVEAGLFGTLLDSWQVPLADVGPKGEDQGKGGKYLLLPPDFRGDAPAGYIAVRLQTYNGYALFRAILGGRLGSFFYLALFWYENSNGLAEIAVNPGRADRDLRLTIGSPVEIIP